MTPTIHHGDCLEVMRSLPDNSVHAIVTDPPYGLSNTTPDQVAETIVKWVSGERDYLPSGRGFMNRAWDAFVPPVAVWDEAMRVLKPGGHVLAFAGSRTHDLMTLGLRLAGADIRDSVYWHYGSGMPKSHNLKGEWSGWGTALKPATEPIVMARKPFRGTVAANVLAHGTGAINVDATRIGTSGGGGNGLGSHFDRLGDTQPRVKFGENKAGSVGRWPANVILDEHMAGVLDEQTANMRAGKPSGSHVRKNDAQAGVNTIGLGLKASVTGGYDDKGGASRFFYVAKASQKERPAYTDAEGSRVAHPTTKPLTLMKYLVRLVTPPNGIVLDPFAGSGTTIEAAMLEGFDCIGIEREAEYLPLIHERIRRATEQNNEAPTQGAFSLEEIA